MNAADFLATEDGQTLVEAGARVSLEHRTNRGWAFGHGEDFGAPASTAGADCRCGRRFLRFHPDDEPTAGWDEHWSSEVLLAILSASKPCPTCAGSGDGQARHPVGRDVAGYWRCTACNYTFGIGGQESARAHSAEEGSGCPSCEGTGTVPILSIPE